MSSDVDELTAVEVAENADGDCEDVDELERFRLLWRQELEDRSRLHRGEMAGPSPAAHLSTEEKAKNLFMLGTAAEEEGRATEAVSYYRQALRLDPDVEVKLAPGTGGGDSDSESGNAAAGSGGEEEEFVEMSRIRPARSNQPCPMSTLPPELLDILIHWVVSSHVDVWSLESLALTCRQLYHATRHPAVWASVCRGSGVEPGPLPRQTFLTVPHLYFPGCYITRITYGRRGEYGLEVYCAAWHTVDYYRYLRFYPGDRVVMYTSSEPPEKVLPKLSSRMLGTLSGRYFITGNRLTISLVRAGRDGRRIAKDLPSASRLELELDITVRRGRSHLIWRNYRITTFMHGGQKESTELHLNDEHYPPLRFSRVRSYSSQATRPLSC